MNYLVTSAFGTVIAPPSITIPDGAVVIEVTWTDITSDLPNNASPTFTGPVMGPRDGAFVAP